MRSTGTGPSHLSRSHDEPARRTAFPCQLSVDHGSIQVLEGRQLCLYRPKVLQPWGHRKPSGWSEAGQASTAGPWLPAPRACSVPNAPTAGQVGQGKGPCMRPPSSPNQRLSSVTISHPRGGRWNQRAWGPKSSYTRCPRKAEATLGHLGVQGDPVHFGVREDQCILRCRVPGASQGVWGV